MDLTYKVIRFFRGNTHTWHGGKRRVIKSGLTLEQAQKHCQNPETCSTTCTNKHGKARTKKIGHWFDGYELET